MGILLFFIWRVMGLKTEILRVLKESKGVFISGQELSDSLGVSRTSIWKHIKQLKQEGYEIESVSRKGYKLQSSPDKLDSEEIGPFLKTKFIGNDILYLETVDSTNEEIKRRASTNAEGLVVISEEQCGGKGRLGRPWSSKKGSGIYMSLLLKPDIDPQEATKITQIAAAATVKGLEESGVSAKIKWPNDIILNQKKIAGILTEMTGELMRIDYIVLGIGINVNNESEDFPEEIRDKASSIKIEEKRAFERKKIVADILNNFEKLYLDFLEKGNVDISIAICRAKSVLLGKDVRILSKGKESIRKAVDISDSGELIVEDKHGKREFIFSGEVSVRGIDGYV